MFFPRSLPLALDDASLLGLRVALNTPVIAIQDLPNGPATAAIAVHLEEGGERALTVALRALRTGETVLYTLDEDLSIEGAAQGAIDAALSFSEAMGFLFDDEMLETDTPANRRRAITRWREVVGEARPLAGVPAAAGRKADSERHDGDAEELVLEETVTLEEPAAPAPRPVPPATADAQSARGAPGPMTLTKFRKRAEAARPGAPAPGSAAAPAAGAPSKVLMTPHGPALGRLQLVKRRRAGDDVEPASWLARLLGSF